MNVAVKAQRYVLDLEAGTVRKMSKGQSDLMQAWSRLGPAQKSTIGGLLEVFGTRKSKRPKGEGSPQPQ